MNVQYEQLSIKKPVKLNTLSHWYILRNIAYNGEGEMVVFISVLDGKPVRMCRMNGSGSMNYYLPIGKNCVFTMKGKGNVTLAFTRYDQQQMDDEVPISYSCDIITEEERRAKK